MKKYFLLFAICVASLNVAAQNVSSVSEKVDTVLSPDMEKILNACISLSNAAASNDKAAIKCASDSLKDCKITEFSSLKCQDKVETSVNGHLVFDEVFADSLAAGKNVFDKADEINRSNTVRGQTANGSILTKTCSVKAGKSTTYTFRSRGHQELAVAAEAGGKVTMKIHVTNNAGFDKRFDDTKDVKPGRNFRKAVFDLPKDTRCNVTLEVINCCKKDISFVVISN